MTRVTGKRWKNFGQHDSGSFAVGSMGTGWAVRKPEHRQSIRAAVQVRRGCGRGSSWWGDHGKDGREPDP